MGQDLKPKIKIKHRPTGLLILDGWGYRKDIENNAIAQANTPNWDKLVANHPNTLIGTSGNDVGLPEGQMGNSEVGHMNLGAGRIVYQELTRIQKDIDDGRFFNNNALLNAIDKATDHDHAVHIMALLSDGGVHSHINHVKASLTLATERGAKTFLHVFTDGRDTAPKSALTYINEIEEHIKTLKGCCIASVTGRFYALDRDARWERTQEAYDVICCGQSEFKAATAQEAVEMAYAREETDEFIQPTAVLNKKSKKTKIKDGDAILFMNFRSDRARQITRAFITEDFGDFHRCKTPMLSSFVTLTQYSKSFENFGVNVAYRPTKLKKTFGQIIAKQQLRQLRIAETEKYAHVTFFFNGGVEEPYQGEDRILIPSPKVRTYDLQPEMSIGELTDKLTTAIESDKYDTFICNIANPDMVGHTGNFDACIKAVEAVDNALGKILESIQKSGGQIIITADHGNIEMLIDPVTGKPLTSHTTCPVPLVYFGSEALTLRSGGALPDVMPTLLELMNIKQPEEMTGISLLAKN